MLYTLTNVWRGGRDNETGTPAAFLTYMNNVLEECMVNQLQVNLASLDLSVNQIGHAEWGVTVSTYINCLVHGQQGVVGVNLTQACKYVPPTVSMAGLYRFLGTNFIERDERSRASLWWSESLLSTYWALLSMQMQQIRQDDTASGILSVRKASVVLSTNPCGVDDVLDPD